MTENRTTRKAVWFYDLQVALLANGGYHLYIAENTVDEEEPQLLCQELLDERVVSIDDVLARLKQVLTAST
jgi:hypothetical protein